MFVESVNLSSLSALTDLAWIQYIQPCSHTYFQLSLPQSSWDCSTVIQHLENVCVFSHLHNLDKSQILVTCVFQQCHCVEVEWRFWFIHVCGMMDFQYFVVLNWTGFMVNCSRSGIKYSAYWWLLLGLQSSDCFPKWNVTPLKTLGSIYGLQTRMEGKPPPGNMLKSYTGGQNELIVLRFMLLSVYIGRQEAHPTPTAFRVIVMNVLDRLRYSVFKRFYGIC